MIYEDFLPQPAVSLIAGYSSPPGLHSFACERLARPVLGPDSWVGTQKDDGENAPN